MQAVRCVTRPGPHTDFPRVRALGWERVPLFLVSMRLEYLKRPQRLSPGCGAEYGRDVCPLVP